MGVISVVNNLFKFHLRRYEYELRRHYQNPAQLQLNTLRGILQDNEETAFAKEHRWDTGNSAAITYSERVPVREYNEFKDWIDRILLGEAGVLTTQRVRALAKTAGTTSTHSKYLPVTRAHIISCQKGCWFTLASLHLHRHDLQIFARKNMLIGGGDYGYYPDSNLPVADISALMIQSIPRILRPFYLPDIELATLPNYEEKIARIAKIAAYEPRLTMLGGVPTWNLALYRGVLAERKADNLLEVWPNLQAYVHGGVNFAPYRAQFQQLIPNDAMLYHEIYNASEGYFAVQDQLDRDDLLLILTNGIYYEFIPFADYQAGSRTAVPIWETNTDQIYAMVITNSSGLYRYLLGDLIRFTQTTPYRIQIVGRTQAYINAFGEDLLSNHTEVALAEACAATGARIKDYTVAPHYLQVQERGFHQWFIEFERPPEVLTQFVTLLDEAVQSVNSNYAQKRSNDFAIKELEVVSLPEGFFRNWLKVRGKQGGQSKVPKLVNHRKFAEDILKRIR